MFQWFLSMVGLFTSLHVFSNFEVSWPRPSNFEKCSLSSFPFRVRSDPPVFVSLRFFLITRFEMCGLFLALDLGSGTATLASKRAYFLLRFLTIAFEDHPPSPHGSGFPLCIFRDAVGAPFVKSCRTKGLVLRRRWRWRLRRNPDKLLSAGDSWTKIL